MSMFVRSNLWVKHDYFKIKNKQLLLLLFVVVVGGGGGGGTNQDSIAKRNKKKPPLENHCNPKGNQKTRPTFQVYYG